jgi:hypothetical protein
LPSGGRALGSSDRCVF